MPKILRPLVLVFLFGCPVQEPTPERTDLGVVRTDASQDDCTDDPSLCVRGERCDRASKTCVANVECDAHADCRVTHRCVEGLCATVPGRCEDATNCASDERCAAAGVCIREIDSSGRLTPVCSDTAACTLGTSCEGGSCTACGADFNCPGALVCRLGRCEEPASCRTSADCFAGNDCSAGRCVRPTTACRTDPENDDIGGAVLLTEVHRAGFELCGTDVDWYALRLDPYVGARLIITPEISASGSFTDLGVAVSNDRGVPISGVSTLSWPGRTIVEVPGLNEARELRLSITGNQQTRYAIDAERIPGLCAGDLLDLLGDADGMTAPPLGLTRLRELVLRACPDEEDHVRLRLARDELLRLGLELDPEEGARLALHVRDLGTGAEETRIFTATVGAALTLPRAAADTELDLALHANRAPELGATYRWLADLETAARFQACAAPVAAASTPNLDMSGGQPLGVSSCAEDVEMRSELVLQVTPPSAPTLMRATLRSTSSTTAQVGLRLLGECTRDSSERSCDVSPRPGLGAGVEGVLTSTQPVFLVLSTTEPSATAAFELSFDEDDNFTCIGSRADRITSSGVVPVSTVEATKSFEIELGSACGPAGSGQGPDRFFEVDVAARQTVVLELTGRPEGMLWAGTTCARLSETCTAAASILDIATPATVILQPSSSTRYVVAVDGYGANDAGDYQLRTIFSPQCLNDSACAGGERCDDYVCAGPPPNDQCPGSALSFGGEVADASGSTAAAVDDFASATCPGGAGGSDVVFSFTLAAPALRLEARVTRANFDPLLYVRRNLCESPDAELICNDDQDLASGNLLPAVVLHNLSAGTYYIVVDAYSFGSIERGGTFDLEVRVVN